MESYPFSPVYDKESKVLILGTFPSVKSREQNFYYGHPQNRFWKVLSRVLECDVPSTIEEKKKMLLEHHIAIWDVIKECEIKGSADSSIKNYTFNDMTKITDCAKIKSVLLNGRAAQKFYEESQKSKLMPSGACTEPVSNVADIDTIYLPSTSPANAAWNLDRLYEEWKVIKKYI